MKINDPNLNGLNPGGLNGNQGPDRTRGTDGIQPGSGPGGSRRGESPSDQVQLSSFSQSLTAAGIDSPERKSQVAQLGSDVSAGRYQPDALQVSQSVIQSTLAGLG